jgi:hypothetical protein
MLGEGEVGGIGCLVDRRVWEVGRSESIVYRDISNRQTDGSCARAMCNAR